MSDNSCLSEDFYDRDPVVVARALLGMTLVREVAGSRMAGVIIETEAYRGEEDLACHARSGRTRRNAVMYGPPGRAYIYFTYGMHWMLNCVCGQPDWPAAVLIRAVLPVAGLDDIAARRPGRPQAEWADGPAKLCRAFQIDGSLNGCDLTIKSGGLFFEKSAPIPDSAVITSPRIGINYAPEPWLSMPWRFQVSSNYLVVKNPLPRDL